MLKKYFLIFLVFSYAQVGFSQGIQFVELTWQEALEKAKSENKLLFVDAYAKWCGPCKNMAKYEFVKEEVGEVYNANFINLKLDMETPNGRTFDSQYPVSAYPTMFFLDGNGTVVKKIRGGQKGEQLISVAQGVIKSHDTSGQFAEKYDGGDRSFDVVYEYVKALNQVGKPTLKISNDYLASNPDISQDQKLKFIHNAVVDADSKIFDLLVNDKDAIVKLVGEEDYNKKVKTACNNTVAKAISYETESLLEEAKSKAKSGLTKGGEVFALECEMRYALEMKDKSRALSIAKSLNNLYLKSNPIEIKKMSAVLIKTFNADAELLTQVEKLCKEYYKKVGDMESVITYASVLIEAKDYSKAQKIIDKGLEDAKKDGLDTANLERMLKIINMKKA